MSNLSKLIEMQGDLDGVLHVSAADIANFNQNLAALAKKDPALAKVILPMVHELMTQAQKGGSEGGKSGNMLSRESIEDAVFKSKGDINITISRSTSNILTAPGGQPIPLPFVLFAPNDFAAQYFNFLKTVRSNLPANVTVAVTTTNTGNVIFTYTQGVVQDIITVSYLGNLNNYASFLQSMNQNYFATKYILYTISDAVNGQLQLTNGIIQIGSIGSMGFQAQNQISVNARIWTWNFRVDRADLIFSETEMVPDTGIVDSIIPCPAADIEANIPFVITYNVFMSKRINLNRMHSQGGK